MKFNFEKKALSRAVGAIVAASAVGFTGSVFAEGAEEAAEEETIVIEVDDQAYELPLRSVDRARAHPRLDIKQDEK